MSDSFVTLWTVPARLPCPWDSPGKNTRVGCYFLLQGIFPSQRLNPCLLLWQVDSLPVSHQGITICFLPNVNYNHHLFWVEGEETETQGRSYTPRLGMKHVFMGRNSVHSRIIINNDNYDAYYLVTAFTCRELIFTRVASFTSQTGCNIISALQLRKQRLCDLTSSAQGPTDRRRAGVHTQTDCGAYSLKFLCHLGSSISLVVWVM